VSAVTLGVTGVVVMGRADGDGAAVTCVCCACVVLASVICVSVAAGVIVVGAGPVLGCLPGVTVPVGVGKVVLVAEALSLVVVIESSAASLEGVSEDRRSSVVTLCGSDCAFTVVLVGRLRAWMVMLSNGEEVTVRSGTCSNRLKEQCSSLAGQAEVSSSSISKVSVGGERLTLKRP
jgi:hypothetical protein